MKLYEIINDTAFFGIKDLPPDLPSFTGVEYDSRKVRAGDLFVAIKGYETDGHQYIKDAEKNGASIIICENQADGVTIPQIEVSDSRKALSLISSKFYDSPSKSMTIIGVTGTNGKSTTASIVENILRLNKIKTGCIGTIDYHYLNEKGETTILPSPNTTPESKDLHKLLSTMKKAGVTHVVMEVSSHSISLERVLDIDFNVLIFTNITQDHLDFHKTMEEYAEVKTDFIQSRVKAFKTKAVLNIDDPNGEKLAEKLSLVQDKVLRFSIEKREAELSTEEFRINMDGIESEVNLFGKIYHLKSPLPGKFNLSNILGAAGAAMTVGINPSSVFESLKNIPHVSGRLEQVKNDSRPYTFIDYAHTPDALENVLKTLKSICKGKLISVFGCGGDRDSGKRPLMGKVSSEIADISIITSDNPRTEDPELILDDIEKGFSREKFKKAVIREEDRRKAIRKAIEISSSEDCILIAGKGHEDYQIIGKEKIFFSDKEVVLEELGVTNASL